MTPFEQAIEQVKTKQLQAPEVIAHGKAINYFGYQLATHHFNLKLMARGLSFKGIKFTDIKKYYGLTGRSAADCLPQFEKVMADYKAKLEKEKETAN